MLLLRSVLQLVNYVVRHAGLHRNSSVFSKDIKGVGQSNVVYTLALQYLILVKSVCIDAFHVTSLSVIPTQDKHMCTLLCT